MPSGRKPLAGHVLESPTIQIAEPPADVRAAQPGERLRDLAVGGDDPRVVEGADGQRGAAADRSAPITTAFASPRRMASIAELEA